MHFLVDCDATRIPGLNAYDHEPPGSSGQHHVCGYVSPDRDKVVSHAVVHAETYALPGNAAVNPSPATVKLYAL